MQHILLVDDDQNILWLVRNLLVQEGMTVQCVESGESALAELKQNTFDLMITDYDMPGLDGLSLTRQVSVIALDMPVILITGNISSEIPHMAKQAGIAKVLAKPFSSEALLETIRGVAGTRRERAVMEVNPMSSDA